MGIANRKKAEIQPIETVYNGFRFRSRLEARWAVFFDALHIPYEYEKEGYQLSNGEWYLPDFYLPEWDWYFEIKGRTPSEKEIDNVRIMAQKSGRGTSLIWGTPGVTKLETYDEDLTWQLHDGYVILTFPSHVKDKVVEWGTDKEVDVTQEEIPIPIELFAEVDGGTRLDVWPLYFHPSEIAKFDNDGEVSIMEMEEDFVLNPIYPKGILRRMYLGKGVTYNTDRLINAYLAARQARFEHGEKGGL